MSNALCNNDKGSPVIGCALADAHHAAKPAKKEQVDPVIKPLKLTVIVKKFFKDSAGHRKAYTKPKRQPVVLSTTTAFDGHGTFTWPTNKIKFFKSADKDDEIRLAGKSKVFKGAHV